MIKQEKQQTMQTETHINNKRGNDNGNTYKHKTSKQQTTNKHTHNTKHNNNKRMGNENKTNTAQKENNRNILNKATQQKNTNNNKRGAGETTTHKKKAIEPQTQHNTKETRTKIIPEQGNISKNTHKPTNTNKNDTNRNNNNKNMGNEATQHTNRKQSRN